MTCPICKSATQDRWRPFCSRRCADVDLARWFQGGYAIPSDDPQDIEEAQEAAEQARRKPD